jgi:predicted nucleic acid-binding protein
MIVVSDTTPLISLDAIGRLAILQQLFGEIIIPQAVLDEVSFARGEAKRFEREIVGAPWIKTVIVRDHHAVEGLLDELDRGEAEAIVLARELKADWVLMDEKKGRRKLSQFGINRVGTLGILLKAKQQGLIQHVRPEIDRLQSVAFRMSPDVVYEILKAAGE